MGQMRASLERKDVPIEEFHYSLATHYHIDHAGLAQEFKQAGDPLLVLDVQVDAIPLMKRWIKLRDNCVEITKDGNETISFSESCSVLEHVGIPGEIIHTPGHSDDRISLLLDDGSAFTGDLTPPQMVGVEDPAVVAASWRLLRESGATRVYPGHGPNRQMDAESIDRTEV